jgi:hypothetical protein
MRAIVDLVMEAAAELWRLRKPLLGLNIVQAMSVKCNGKGFTYQPDEKHTI